jgi:hypothetical protein
MTGWLPKFRLNVPNEELRTTKGRWLFLAKLPSGVGPAKRRLWLYMNHGDLATIDKSKAYGAPANSHQTP